MYAGLELAGKHLGTRPRVPAIGKRPTGLREPINAPFLTVEPESSAVLHLQPIYESTA